jgi:hypothetical protein
MLGLGGELIDALHPQPTDDERIREMKECRDLLQKLTKRDFGFDLAAWHEYLLRSEEHADQYTHPYAWNAVRPKIAQLIESKDRIRLVRLLESRATDAAGWPGLA